jgi:hypothetical protein
VAGFRPTPDVSPRTSALATYLVACSSRTRRSLSQEAARLTQCGVGAWEGGGSVLHPLLVPTGVVGRLKAVDVSVVPESDALATPHRVRYKDLASHWQVSHLYLLLGESQSTGHRGQEAVGGADRMIPRSPWLVSSLHLVSFDEE